MAYLENQNDDEQKKQADVQAQAQLQLSAGGQPGAVANPAAGAASKSPNAGGTPGRYVNFARYFSANQDQAQKLGNSVGDSLEKAGTDVQNELVGKQQTFANAVQAGSQSPAATLGKPPPSNSLAPTTPGTKGASAPSLTGQTPAAPSSDADLKKMAAQKYTGPSALSDDRGAWQGFADKANAAESRVKQTGVAGGTQALLQDRQKGTGYSQGQSRFDAGLVGAASGDRFGRLRERFSGLGETVQKADAASQAQGNAARSTVEARAAGAQKQLEANAAQRSAEQARKQAEHEAELAAKAEAEREYWRSDEGRKQYAADQETYKWQQKFLDNAPSEVLDGLYRAKAYGSNSYDLTHPGVRAWVDYLAKRYGEGVAREWLNAARDDEGRYQRGQAYHSAHGTNRPTGDTRDPLTKLATDPGVKFVQDASDWTQR